MVYSEAFQALKLSERKVLDFALLERKIENVGGRGRKKRFEPTNNILIPYRQLNEPPFNLNNSTVTRAIDRLLALGFLTIIERGGSRQGHASKYKLIDKWQYWKPGDEPIETRQKYCNKPFTKKSTHA